MKNAFDTVSFYFACEQRCGLNEEHGFFVMFSEKMMDSGPGM